ncbi:MAG: hypothetical protein LUC98_03315, partial [Lachnospiraceae bacterium]|nr:hypothetical protein [Lachnospiraceae bacterium]
WLYIQAFIKTRYKLGKQGIAEPLCRFSRFSPSAKSLNYLLGAAPNPPIIASAMAARSCGTLEKNISSKFQKIFVKKQDFWRYIYE